MMRSTLQFAVVLVTLYLAPVAAQACGVCMGQTEGSQIGGAVNGAIFVMLGFIGAMLSGIGAVAYSFWRRAKSPLPAHLELAELIGSQTASK